MERETLHPFNDLDKISFNKDLETHFDKYKEVVFDLFNKKVITQSEYIAILTLIREALGLPFVACHKRDKCIDNITLQSDICM